MHISKPPPATLPADLDLNPAVWGCIIAAMLPFALFAAAKVQISLGVPFDTQADKMTWHGACYVFAVLTAFYYFGIVARHRMTLRNRVIGGFAILYMAIQAGIITAQLLYGFLDTAQFVALLFSLVVAFVAACQAGYFLGPFMRRDDGPRSSVS